MSATKKSAFQKHGFTLALVGVLFFAAIYPNPGIEGGLMRSEWTTKIGVWVIFLLQGLSLPGKELARGYRPLRLQAFVLVWNYLFFPLVVLLGLFCFNSWLSPELALGFGLLSILPTTIASAVAFTALAGGRVASAICATVFSNLLAVLIVPLWAALYLQAGDASPLPVLPLLGELTLLIVFPTFIGQALLACLPGLAQFLAKSAKRVSAIIILFIVYCAFAESLASDQFSAFSLHEWTILLFGSIGLLLLVSVLVWCSSAFLKLSYSERIAAFFCASQKSLATGLPLVTVILAVCPESISTHTGVLLLPLIVFHPLQLVLASIWAEKSLP